MTESPTVAAALAPVDAVIFDLDGVVTDTAELHAAAWKELFDAVLQDERIPQGARRDPFKDSDYRSFVDGRTREDGVVTFLGSRGVTLPAGEPSDKPTEWTVFGLGARKNGIFEKLLGLRTVPVFPGTLALLERLKAGRIPVVWRRPAATPVRCWPPPGSRTPSTSLSTGIPLRGWDWLASLILPCSPRCPGTRRGAASGGSHRGCRGRS